MASIWGSRMAERRKELDEGTRSKLFDIIDTYIRDARAREAYK